MLHLIIIKFEESLVVIKCMNIYIHRIGNEPFFCYDFTMEFFRLEMEYLGYFLLCVTLNQEAMVLTRLEHEKLVDL